MLWSLGLLIGKLSILKSELIFDEKISSFKYADKDIGYYLRLLDKDLMILLVSKIQKSLPFCSNNYDEYQYEENIILGECKVKDTDIEIIENFLTCAMYLDAPVVTPKTFCSQEEFLKDKIELICNTATTFLDNFFIEESENIIKKIEENIKLNGISWDNWRERILPLYENVSVSDECFDDMSIYSFTSKYKNEIIDFEEKINLFLKDQNVNNINFEECCSHTTKESGTRLKKFKNQLLVKNCTEKQELATWHTRINQDFRLYFTCDIESNKICLVKLTKKLS